MRRVLTTCAAVALTAGGAHAGGVERSSQSVAILFEQGSYAELSFGRVSPSVSGNLAPVPAVRSGDMAPGYNTVSLGYKTDLTDQISMAVILDQPIGADVAYPAGTLYPATGSTASIDAMAVTGILRYRFPSNFSVYAGLRAQSASGEVALQPSGYTMSTSTETDYGWLAGVAYERPEIALRVALTYNSAIDHTFTVQENGTPSLPFTTTVPQSWNLEFQTGIMADTLLFGSIRYVDWTAFDITPAGFAAANGGASLVSYDDDTTTYTLGVGRRFNDTWSGSISFSHEPGNGPFSGNLGPTDGFTSAQVAAVYTMGNMKITGGLRYIDIGEAQTRLGPVTTNFSGNHGWAAGLRIGYSF